MSDKNESVNTSNPLKDSLTSQHQVWGNLIGFAVNGLVIFLAFKSDSFDLTQKIFFTLSVISLFVQVLLMTIISEMERRISFKSDLFLQNLENIIRPFLNITCVLSWLFIGLLLLISIWF